MNQHSTGITITKIAGKNPNLCSIKVHKTTITMQTEEILKEARARFADFRNEMQEVSMKTALGASEAREAFEREWGRFSSFVDEQGNKIKRQGAWTARMTERLDQRLHRLNELVTKGRPVADGDFSPWRDEVVGVIYEIEFIIHELYPLLKDDERDLFSMLRVKMEIFRTNLVLKTWQNYTETDSLAEAMIIKVEEVMRWHADFSVTNEEKLEKFRTELQTSLKHFKGAFGELFR